MLTAAGIMEALMVICFGASWPLNISKAWKAKTARGISLQFYLLIWIGYIFAIIGKSISIYYHLEVAKDVTSWMQVVPWYVFFFYILNTLMVSSGILIYFRNVRLDKQAASDK